MATKRRKALEFPKPFEPVRKGEHWLFEAEGKEVRLSNLTKVYFPEDGYTKGDLLGSYFNLAEWLFPHLRDRPLTLYRMPDGIHGPAFYEKQAPAHTPDWVPRGYVEGHGRRGATDFLMAQDVASLLYVVNLGCIELHPMHARVQSFDRPDYAFFDLDPFPPITFAQVRRVALMVKVALDNLGLRGYPKTSGATGMQVYVPLDGSHSYDEARAFVERVCRLIHHTWPQGTTMEWEVSKRSGKVFLDYAMVSEGRNIACVYSIRPRPGAPLSTPLEWDEVEEDVEPEDFTIRTIWPRLHEKGDLFAGVLDGGSPKGQNLRAAMEELGIEPPARETAPAPAPAQPLVEYKKKRKFDVTPEPAGAVAPTDGNRFVIHKHHARRLHYDLRLERGGVLVSWAVPKGIPEQPDVRRLAVHVEDHPLEYGSFEGAIPEGEYGAGEVRIFDEGTYEPLEWTDKKVSFRLRGRRLTGEYHLVKTDEKNWLLFRSKRAEPLPPAAAAPPLEPMLATAGGKPFDRKGWVFEPKWDGVRTLAYLDGETVKLRSRRGRDVTELYGELKDISEQLSGRNAVVDGEIVSLGAKGRPSFENLQQRFTLGKPSARVAAQFPVEFLAFDLLWLDGESLLERPLEERRDLLERSFVPGGRVQISPQVPEKGVRFFEAAKAQGLEGVIAKKLGSIYRPGQRSKDWVKIKALNRQDCVIVGWSPGEGRRTGTLGSLLVAVVRDGTLQYAGHVGTGFTERTLKMLTQRLEPLEVPEPPIPPPPKDEVDVRGVRWVRPEIVCEVEYLQFTSYGRLRAPSYKGLRLDKVPEDCILEPPAS